MAKKSPLADALSGIKDRIAAAAAKAKRDPADVTLIAVTKTAAPEQIRSSSASAISANRASKCSRSAPARSTNFISANCSAPSPMSRAGCAGT